MAIVEAVRWTPDGAGVRIIDQRRLPGHFEELDLRRVEEVVDAIATLAVRGAPAIGVCAAMGLVASLNGVVHQKSGEFRATAAANAARIRAARPTAVNLAWAIDRMTARLATLDGSTTDLLAGMRAEASQLLVEDQAMCQRIGDHGEALIPNQARILTHCNAGALATAGIGTALAPIYRAVERGKHVEVYADETRPLLQGSRLTAWELQRAGIPVTVIADSMAASLLRAGRIDLCIVGADRVAANGDVANKIGTYGLAVLCHHHAVPFYVAAPESTLDAGTPTGNGVPIEERAPDEVVNGFGRPTAPTGVAVWNPAFDITPASLITGIVTDRGVHRPPYAFGPVAR